MLFLTVFALEMMHARPAHAKAYLFVKKLIFWGANNNCPEKASLTSKSRTLYSLRLCFTFRSALLGMLLVSISAPYIHFGFIGNDACSKVSVLLKREHFIPFLDSVLNVLLTSVDFRNSFIKIHF